MVFVLGLRQTPLEIRNTVGSKNQYAVDWMIRKRFGTDAYLVFSAHHEGMLERIMGGFIAGMLLLNRCM